MSRSADRKNDRREAQPRAEELEKSFVHAPPERVRRIFALLTKTYHGCRLSGGNPLYPYLRLAETRLLRSARSALAAILPVFPRRLQLPGSVRRNMVVNEAGHLIEAPKRPVGYV